MENTATAPISFRVLCSELANELHKHTSLYEGHECELVAHARTALAAVPEGEPSEEDIITYWNEVCAGEGDYGVLMLARYARRTN